MPANEFLVVGITHVDLAWKRGPAEMSEMYEIVVARLLDLLEAHPTFRYMIEQASHLRWLSQRRPDLVERLKPYIASGRLEIVGAMASTLEVNLPNGESLVRNQSLGLRWVRDHLNAPLVRTAWLVDTFGIHAQMPQVLKQFGFSHLMANRFGGDNTLDAFIARGIDGTPLFIAGWTSFAGHIRPVNVAKTMVQTWDGIEDLKERAARLTSPGPRMVVVYTENEMLISSRSLALCEEQMRDRPGDTWRVATPGEWFDAALRSGHALPERDADLNPEFTGCFSLRMPIRLRNRSAENRLLEAEKWSALAGLGESTAAIEEAWWQLAYVQFHDVFTGSHPTSVYHDVMRVLDEVHATADGVLQKSFAALTTQTRDANAITLFNGLPVERTARVRLPADMQPSRITDPQGHALPLERDDESAAVLVTLPAAGSTTLTVHPGNPAPLRAKETVERAVIENEFVRLTFDHRGLAELRWKPTDTVLLNDKDMVVSQVDNGSMQIEQPDGAEVGWSSGTMTIEKFADSEMGSRVRLSGELPKSDWKYDTSRLAWTAEFTLAPGKPNVSVHLSVDWNGEGRRVRFRVPTTIDSITGIYEIPFGVVKRTAYSPRANAKGEWPAHRFVAIEDGTHGVAVINAGTAGVEVLGGSIFTTLLRAPKHIWAGIPLDTFTSAHGTHNYDFVLVPYSGTWSNSGVIQAAQELNSPVHVVAGAAADSTSHIQIDRANIVLSTVKLADDQSGEVVVRVYESAGVATSARLDIPGIVAAAASDLTEHRGDELAVSGGAIQFSIKPFEIKTFRVRR